MNTPEMIDTLQPNQIFVFGSNLAGRHGAGAALLAAKKFGAVYGHGEGLTGHAYALPTLDGSFGKRSERELKLSIMRFKLTVQDNPELEFLVTKVGCGLAGYTEDYMKSLFASFRWPENVIFPEGWS